MLNDNIVLYHGSYMEVEKPDIAKCREGKDFGKGFYLTSDKNQAKRFVRHSLARASQRGDVPKNRAYGFLSIFTFSGDAALRCYHFPDADAEWLHCVVAHRDRKSIPGERKKWSGYDVISGKIANDFTNAVIATYLDGGYGTIGSALTDQTAIRLLEPDRLKDQYCFRTKKALNNLSFLKSERINL